MGPKMKTLTFILYFVAILGLIEANWRVIDQRGFHEYDQSTFLSITRDAISRDTDHDYRMKVLRALMKHRFRGSWNCFYGDLSGSWRRQSHFWITIENGSNQISCYERR